MIFVPLLGSANVTVPTEKVGAVNDGRLVKFVYPLNTRVSAALGEYVVPVADIAP
jgi:hypothetical protein